MKENYWIRQQELAADGFRKQQQQEAQQKQQTLKDKQDDDDDDDEQQQQQEHPKPWLKARAHEMSQNHHNNGNNNNNNNNSNSNSTNIKSQSHVIAKAETSHLKKKQAYPTSKDTCETTTTTTTPISQANLLSAEKQGVKKKRQQVKKDEHDVNLSFCGCGFLGIYHVGVASCFHEYAPQLSMHKISGSSAGALVAVAHICGNLQLAYATTDILRVAIDARARALGPFHPSFDINATVREALERGLPDDVHLKANGKLHVSLTRVYDGENVIISQFESKEDVIQVLLCSCFIPFWSGLVAPKYKGVAYIDGGFSNNLLILDDKTVTVSPFAGESDICPQDDTFNLLQVSLSNTSFSISPNNLYRLSHALLPPPPEVLSDLCEQGFADGIRFLQQMKLISCTKCLEIKTSLLVTTNGEDMEEAFTHEVHNSSESASMLNFNESHHHIRLEQQEQKMIEISGSERRNSVVSTTSQIYCQQQQQPLGTTTTTTTTTNSTTTIKRSASHCSWLSGLGNGNEMLESCDECVLMRQKALDDPLLPSQFSDRIRDACDTVNKSLSNWIYSHRPIKYLSYLAAPYYLPIDISLALIFRCWQRLPFIRSELINCVQNIVDFLIGMVKRMNAKSTTSRLLMSSMGYWNEEDAIEYEKNYFVKSSSSSSSPSSTGHHHQNNNLNNINISSCVGAGSSNNSQSNGSGSNGIGGQLKGSERRKISCGSNHTTTSSIATGSSSSTSNRDSLDSAFSVKITSEGVCVSKLRNSQRSSSTNQLHSLEDTFDSIVDVTSNQEARIFAYYFRDAKNRLQVTEIFDLERAAELSHHTPNIATPTPGPATTPQMGNSPTTNPKQHQSHHNPVPSIMVQSVDPSNLASTPSTATATAASAPATEQPVAAGPAPATNTTVRERKP